MQQVFEIKGNGLNSWANITTEYPVDIAKEVAMVANNVAKAHIKAINKEIRKELNLPAKEVGKALSITQRARPDSIVAKIKIKKERRPSLRAYKAKQIKMGVSYKISKTKGTKKVKGAFIVQKLNNQAFKRRGKKRFPITKLHGPSIWGVYRGQGLLVWSQEQLSDEFGKQTAKRQRAVIVRLIKKQGRKEGKTTEQINQMIKAKLG